MESTLLADRTVLWAGMPSSGRPRFGGASIAAGLAVMLCISVTGGPAAGAEDNEAAVNATLAVPYWDDLARADDLLQRAGIVEEYPSTFAGASFDAATNTLTVGYKESSDDAKAFLDAMSSIGVVGSVTVVPDPRPLDVATLSALAKQVVDSPETWAAALGVDDIGAAAGDPKTGELVVYARAAVAKTIRVAGIPVPVRVEPSEINGVDFQNDVNNPAPSNGGQPIHLNGES